MENQEQLNLRVFLDAFSTINLNADFFESAEIQTTEKGAVEVRVTRNRLSNLLKSKMKCVLALAGQKPLDGRIQKVTRQNGTIFLECQFNGKELAFFQ